jgi:hypothetical protein
MVLVRAAGLVVAATATLVLAEQVPLQALDRHTGSVLDSKLRSKISTIVGKGGIPGYSVAVFRAGAGDDVEYAQWGNRTEEGDSVAADVRRERLLRCL